MKTKTHELKLYSDTIIVTFKHDNDDFFIVKLNEMNGNPIDDIEPLDMKWIHGEISEYLNDNQFFENESNDLKYEILWDLNDER